MIIFGRYLRGVFVNDSQCGVAQVAILQRLPQYFHRFYRGGEGSARKAAPVSQYRIASGYSLYSVVVWVEAERSTRFYHKAVRCGDYVVVVLRGRDWVDDGYATVVNWKRIVRHLYIIYIVRVIV